MRMNFMEGNDELQDDMINFKDSDQESIVSYFERYNVQKSFVIDTPTRIVNESNEFLK